MHGRPDADGCFVDEGYIYSRARYGYRRVSGFSGRCGTCHVLHWRHYEVPDECLFTRRRPRSRRPSASGCTHCWVHTAAPARGSPDVACSRALPLRGAVYQVDTGEKHSGTDLRGLARPLGRRLKRDFRHSKPRRPA